jgi:hypothetical protein
MRIKSETFHVCVYTRVECDYIVVMFISQPCRFSLALWGPALESSGIEMLKTSRGDQEIIIQNNGGLLLVPSSIVDNNGASS